MKFLKRSMLLQFFPLLLIGQFANCQIAQTPPMGWNSYNCFGSAVHEDEVKANADYVSQHLKQFGWQYVVVDFLWSYDNPPGSTIGNPFQMQLQDEPVCLLAASYEELVGIVSDYFSTFSKDEQDHFFALNAIHFYNL